MGGRMSAQRSPPTLDVGRCWEVRRHNLRGASPCCVAGVKGPPRSVIAQVATTPWTVQSWSKIVAPLADIFTGPFVIS